MSTAEATTLEELIQAAVDAQAEADRIDIEHAKALVRRDQALEALAACPDLPLGPTYCRGRLVDNTDLSLPVTIRPCSFIP